MSILISNKARLLSFFMLFYSVDSFVRSAGLINKPINGPIKNTIPSLQNVTSSDLLITQIVAEANDIIKNNKKDLFIKTIAKTNWSYLDILCNLWVVEIGIKSSNWLFRAWSVCTIIN